MQKNVVMKINELFVCAVLAFELVVFVSAGELVAVECESLINNYIAKLCVNIESRSDQAKFLQEIIYQLCIDKKPLIDYCDKQPQIIETFIQDILDEKYFNGSCFEVENLKKIIDKFPSVMCSSSLDAMQNQLNTQNQSNAVVNLDSICRGQARLLCLVQRRVSIRRKLIKLKNSCQKELSKLDGKYPCTSGLCPAKYDRRVFFNDYAKIFDENTLNVIDCRNYKDEDE